MSQDHNHLNHATWECKYHVVFTPKALLIAENLCLRQQLVVLQRRHPRPRLSDTDRRFWILASRWFSDWRNPLLIVKPETVCSDASYS